MNILNKHIRQEHITTLYPCITCDFQAKTIYDLREHQNTHIGDQVSRKTSVTCELCNFATDTQASLHMHERNIHKKSKYHCNLCSYYFTKSESLEEHKASKHNIGVFPCNDCGLKAKSITELDEHIKYQHKHQGKDKNIDIRDLSDRVPCNPFHPSHTSECCDRGYFRHTGQDKRRSRGQCRYWTQGKCHRGNSCQFAHIQLCKFQDQCLFYESCGYLHNSEQNNSFLESRNNRFIYREEDFPKLERFRKTSRNQ